MLHVNNGNKWEQYKTCKFSNASVSLNHTKNEIWVSFFNSQSLPEERNVTKTLFNPGIIIIFKRLHSGLMMCFAQNS